MDNLTSPGGGDLEYSTGFPMPKTINGKEVPDLFIAGQPDSWWTPKSSLTQKDVDSFFFGNSAEQKAAGVKPPNDSLKLPEQGEQPVDDGPSGETSEVFSTSTTTYSMKLPGLSMPRLAGFPPPESCTWSYGAIAQLDRIEEKLDKLLRGKVHPRNQA